MMRDGGQRSRPFHPLRRVLWVVLFLGMAGGSGGTFGQDDLAARQLETGDRLAAAGKVVQAQAAWREVVARYPDSPSASAALDRLGSTAYPAEELAARGQMPAASLDQARAMFETIVREYQASPQAPRALFKLGLLFSDPAAAFFDLDEAYARFTTITTLYPASEQVDQGLLGEADVLATQGQCQPALKPLSTLLLVHGESPLLDQAWFLAGRCLGRLGKLRAALRAFQELRDQIPASPLATVARDRTTHLARLLRGGSRAPAALYTRFDLLVPSLPAGERLRSVTAMAADEKNRIILVDERAGAVHVLDAKGRPLSRLGVRRPSAVFAHGDLLLVGADGEVVSGGKGTSLTGPGGRVSLLEIGFLGRDPRQRLIVWDRRTGSLLRYKRDLSFESVLVEGRERRIDAVTLAEDGTLYLLDARRERVSILPPGGGGTREMALAPAAGLPRPDTMAIDFLGNLFVMDRADRSLVVFGPEGKELAHLSSGRDATDPFPRPDALAVNRRGEILIYDERRRGVVVAR
ncbi:MAG: tetratricopeptide repeat protein [Acidobacteriota bacterium]